MSEELAVQNDGRLMQSLTAADIRAQVNLIQQVMKEVMQGPSAENPNGVHYGIVPGCGKKMVLLKPGAEKLSMTFRLRPLIDNERDVNITELPSGHREVRVNCHILSASGMELATGIGSCSTAETKYRYRGGEKVATGKPVPKEYWNLKKDGKTSEAQELIGGRGFGAAKVDGEWQICEIGEKAENPDIADVYNTVLKMAKKRAYIDGILSATGASDIFTQDLEPEDADGSEGERKPEIKPPQSKSSQTTPPPPEEKRQGNPNQPAEIPGEEEERITEPQSKRFYAIWSGSKRGTEEMKAYIFSRIGSPHTKDIPKRMYDEMCAYAGKKAE
jgi:hypothetical protein